MDAPFPKILGIGTPILDIILYVSPQFLKEVPGEHGGAVAIEHDDIHQLIAKSNQTPLYVAGGSCGNTLRGLCQLGHSCSMIGAIGNDEEGAIFLESFSTLPFTPLFFQSEHNTSHVLLIVTPDGERTMRSFMGAAKDMTPDLLTSEHFSNCRHVHIEGYQLLIPGLVEKAVKLAKYHACTISLDLGSFEIAQDHRERILEISKEVDLLFCNYKEFCKIAPPQEMLPPTLVITKGVEGCWVTTKTTTLHYPAFPVKPVDSSGAGDLFISGFLHEYLKGASTAKCCETAAILAAEVVKYTGAAIPDGAWKDINVELKNTDRSKST